MMNTVKGRIGSKKKRDERSDVCHAIIKAILNCNRISSKSKEISTGEYESLFGSCRSADGQMTSSYGGEEFEASLLEISKVTGMTTDKLLSELYVLQLKGVLTYSLSDSSLLVDVKDDEFRKYFLSVSVNLASQMEENAHETKASFQHILDHCLWNIAEKVHLQIAGLSCDSARRVIDMWHLGGLINHLAPSMSYNDEAPSADKTQGSIMSVMCQYMSNEADRDIHVSADVDAEAVESYHGVNVPFSRMSAADVNGPLAGTNALTSKIERHILVLARCPSIQGLVQDLSKKCSSAGLTESEDSRITNLLRAAAKECTALYSARVLHALPSSRFGASEWKERSHWSACKDTPFEDVLQLAKRVITDIAV